jgi:hypothetical protein
MRVSALILLALACSFVVSGRNRSGGGYYGGGYYGGHGGYMDMDSYGCYPRRVPKRPDACSPAQWLALHYIPCPATGKVDADCKGYRMEWITPVTTANLHDKLNWWTNVRWVKR